jgi:hypothetical protein
MWWGDGVVVGDATLALRLPTERFFLHLPLSLHHPRRRAETLLRQFLEEFLQPLHVGCEQLRISLCEGFVDR